MKEPVKPNDEDCCNSGCNPCIFDVYEKQLKLYEDYKRNGETYSVSENDMSPLEYKSFIVINNTDLCNEHKLLLFKLNNSNKKNHINWSPGDHFLYKFVSKDYSCTRAYTPLKSNKDDFKDYDFAIIIKRYKKGLVSNFLCDLNIGDLTLWRGPYGNYSVPKDIKRIIMVAQGTGISPFYSIIQHIINNEENMIKIFLIYCCRDVESILLRQDLYNFKSYWNFVYEVYVSDAKTNPVLKYKEPIVLHKLNNEDIMKLKPFSVNDQFLICGSNIFMDHYRELFIKENVDTDAIKTF